ncbi:Cephalosporin-C deacetylase [Verrucomicrobium sp. GAS474]|uniref:acetylxylan esterase n=1 Tax=Verrucomicrobium sp. GAS474 TaxID=1882831 RepID=UPI00087B8B62|nr:acetylxylan esterase [Verrucomicrobium sp. GAS474]SDU24469.1 Cephalosporin-C deacetylase [Verrucomicrobium sp. GAS474]
MRCLLSALLLFPSLALWAGELTLIGTTDKEQAFYDPGEKMVFTIRLADGAAPDAKLVAGKKLKWTRTGDDAKTETGEMVSSETEPLVITTSIDKPGFVRIEVAALDEGGKPLVNSKGSVRFDGGAGVEPEKLEGVPEPADFDSFWTAQKARLAEVPMKVSLTEIPSPDPAFVVYDVKIDCAGGKPVSGYFTKPKDAAPKSLKARAGFMGYGVGSPPIDREKETLVLTINAHGIENGKDAAYYEALKNGELKGYAFKNDENAKPETAYFNGMILRVLRALEFLKSQPEWNGHDLIVSGGSQGGFQSLAGAALDKDVTLCRVGIPWCCDLGGITLGRLRGWRPDYVAGLGYYDGANMAKRITCPTTIVAGLGDYVCPPSGVCVLYNNLKAAASRQLEFVQGRTHAFAPAVAQRTTLKSP